MASEGGRTSRVVQLLSQGAVHEDVFEFAGDQIEERHGTNRSMRESPNLGSSCRPLKEPLWLPRRLSVLDIAVATVFKDRVQTGQPSSLKFLKPCSVPAGLKPEVVPGSSTKPRTS